MKESIFRKIYKKTELVLGLCLMIVFCIGCSEAEYIEEKYQIDTLADAKEGESTGNNPKTEEILDITESEENIETDQEKKMLAVYICGAVNVPGVYELEEGARVVDAIEAARGLTVDADTILINQARCLMDGEQIQILTKEEARIEKEREVLSEEVNSPADDTQILTGQSSKVNINEADVSRLMTLPGIGQVKAEAIVKYRSEHGRFTSISDLQNVSGIKESVFSKLKDLITI